MAWAVSTSGHHDQQENTVILQVIITSWSPSYFLVACGTPTVSIFIWVNYDISPTPEPSQSRGFPRTNHLWDGRHVTSLWVFPKLRFRCVQLRVCHLCRRRRSSRYPKALAPVRLCRKNPIANPPPSTGHESHANLPRCPDHAIEEKVHRPLVWRWCLWQYEEIRRKNKQSILVSWALVCSYTVVILNIKSKLQCIALLFYGPLAE